MRDRDFYLYDDGHSRVTISREGLRRAYEGKGMAVIVSSNGYSILVDDDDYEYLSSFRWHVAKGYARRGFRLNGRVVLDRMHRQVMGLEIDDPRQVDHINGDRLDNRKANLRICTASENSCNRKKRSDNKSGFKGVYFDKKVRRWRSVITKDGVKHILGYFDTTEDAHAAYRKAAIAFHKEFSNAGE